MPTALPTDNIRRWFTESCQTITSHAIINDENISSMITYRRIYRWIISVGISQRVATQLPPMPYLPTDNSSVITVEISDGFIPSVMFPRETFFFVARVSVCKTVGGWFFLFATELATKRVVTDDYYTDRRVPSVRPSVIIWPTTFIPDTDRISPSVKLFNGVVSLVEMKLKLSDKYFNFVDIYIYIYIYIYNTGIYMHQCLCLSKLVFVKLWNIVCVYIAK
jgi:hypothetical protein